MEKTSDDFVFKKQEHITPKRLDIVLTALEAAGVHSVPAEPLGSTNLYAISEMDEVAMAEYLSDFLYQVQEGRMEIEYLNNHVVFQTVLAKAKATIGA